MFLFDDLREVLLVPPIIAELHKKNPDAVLNLLVRVADGGNADDSNRAVCYAMEMVFAPGMGDMVAGMYKAANYDTVDKDWGRTPREHWLKHLRGKLTK